MKQIELVKVDGNVNNNKFYKMIQESPDNFTVKWGRVGYDGTTTRYPMHKWDQLYRSKIKKGYQDITSLRVDAATTFAYKELQDRSIQKLLNDLQKYAKQSVSENYTVSAEAVTKAKIDEAQSLIDQIANYINDSTRMQRGAFDIYHVNNLLQKLYVVIPRKMIKVQNHILSQSDNCGVAKRLIDREQSNIDTLAAQVDLSKPHVPDQTLEEALGLKIVRTTDEDIEIIEKLLGPNSSQLRNAFVVDNLKSRKVFEEQRKNSHKHWTKLLWHGSRNENWLNIMKTSLKIRPSGVVLTGAMFGNGIYFADKAQKSIGYTSLRGSYWARGSEGKGYIALYDVNTGMEYRTKSRESWMGGANYNSLRRKGEYDSLFAEGGVDLRNNEYIVYKDSQCTIKYLVELAG